MAVIAKICALHFPAPVRLATPVTRAKQVITLFRIFELTLYSRANTILAFLIKLRYCFEQFQHLITILGR